jgi:hypothetical protein
MAQHHNGFQTCKAADSVVCPNVHPQNVRRRNKGDDVRSSENLSSYNPEQCLEIHFRQSARFLRFEKYLQTWREQTLSTRHEKPVPNVQKSRHRTRRRVIRHHEIHHVERRQELQSQSITAQLQRVAS